MRRLKTKPTKNNPLTVITIAIDAMGGDHGPSVTVPAALAVLESHADVHLILVGNSAALQQELANHKYDVKRLTVLHTSQQVEMDELPSQALRTKKDSSMRVAINLLKEGKARASVSAGNTGALMATARFVLKTLPGVDRPAIISTFPTIYPDKNVRLLDLGANVDSSAENLVQFAVMGSVLSATVDNRPNPRVFLLNIGEEEIKGNEQVKQTASLLANSNIVNYIGYIEGDALFAGDADVIVCDGFVGNVTLKTTEGVVRFIGRMTKAAFMKNAWTKFVGLLVKPVLKSMIKRVDPGSYNGAIFIGLNGTVVKSHGSANVQAFARAIEEAIIQVEKNVLERIRYEIEQLLKLNPKSS